MTRISNNKVAPLVGGLLWLAAAGPGIAQETGGDRYAQALARADATTNYNAQLEQQIRSQEQEIAALEEQLALLDSTALDVQPLLQRMFDDLVQFVANDLPFFKEERDQRIARLTELMASVEASPSEKFRRLIEAYQIELEYGRTMSAYRQTLDDGRDAEIVRLGRVVLLYRVIGSTESGHWDHEQKRFVADPASSRRIEEALGIAKEERAPDLIIIPMPAPQGGRS